MSSLRERFSEKKKRDKRKEIMNSLFEFKQWERRLHEYFREIRYLKQNLKNLKSNIARWMIKDLNDNITRKIVRLTLAIKIKSTVKKVIKVIQNAEEEKFTTDIAATTHQDSFQASESEKMFIEVMKQQQITYQEAQKQNADALCNIVASFSTMIIDDNQSSFNCIESSYKNSDFKQVAFSWSFKFYSNISNEEYNNNNKDQSDSYFSKNEDISTEQVICFKCCKAKHKFLNCMSMTVSKNVRDRVQTIVIWWIEERNEYERNFNQEEYENSMNNYVQKQSQTITVNMIEIREKDQLTKFDQDNLMKWDNDFINIFIHEKVNNVNMKMSWEQKWMKEIMTSEKRTAKEAEFQASDQRSKAVLIAEQSNQLRVKSRHKDQENLKWSLENFKIWNHKISLTRHHFFKILQ